MTGTNAKPEGKGTSRVATQGAIGGLLLGVAAFLVRPKAPRVSAEATTTERHKTLLLEDAAAALSPAEITAISTSFGSTQPVGKFLRGRHGVTHYYLQSPESRGTGQTFLNAAGASRLIVMTHGIGTNMQLYDKVVSALLDDGFTVLRYDYFGHGWSAPDDKYGVYDKTMINEQLEDLLDHVVGGLTSPTARGAPFPVYGFVGHSTGGCVGVLAASALKDYKFERLYLVSPCFWKEAPLLSNLAGKVPAFVTTVSRSGALDSTTADSYATAGIIAWMREGGTGAYLWPEAVAKKTAEDAVMFKHHPFVTGGIGALDLYIINQAMMPGYREMMKEAVAAGSKVLVVWGEGDQTVPNTKENFAECAAITETVNLEGVGHESIYENPVLIAEKARAFFAK